MAQKTLLPRQFGKIVLTLENCLLSDNKLQETPSQQDGLDKDIETNLRILGCEFIQIAGILLKLPQVAMATGQVLFQRFYYSKSYLRYSMEVTAMSCIWLASKIEEAPRRIRDVINVFHHIKQVRAQKLISPMLLDTTYVALQSQVINAERRVLKELGFCVHVKHPHKLIVMYLQLLGYEKNQKLMQMAWNFMNDSLRTDVFVRFNPESIACACIYLAARKIQLPMPNDPAWYGVFNVIENDILDISYKIMDLYRRPKTNAEELEHEVEKLKNILKENRNKSKIAQNTPPVVVVDRNDGLYNALGNFVSRALPLDIEKEKNTLQPPTIPVCPPNNDSTNESNQQSEQCQRDDSNKDKSQLSRDKQLTRRSVSKSRSKSTSQSPHTSKQPPRSKTHRNRSRSRSSGKHKASGKRKSRNYSRSVSLSPSRHSKKSSRLSNDDRNQRKHREHKRDYSRDRHDRYDRRSHRSRQEKFRDRKR